MLRELQKDGNMKKGPHTSNVFIAHASAENARLREDFLPELKKALKEQGFSLWADDDQLTPGANWSEQLLNGMRSSRNIVLIMGPKQKGNRQPAPNANVYLEVGALETLWNYPKKRIIPLVFGDVRLPSDLSGLPAIEVGDTPEEWKRAIQKVIRAIKAPAHVIKKSRTASPNKRAERQARLSYIEKAAQMLRSTEGLSRKITG